MRYWRRNRPRSDATQAFLLLINPVGLRQPGNFDDGHSFTIIDGRAEWRRIGGPLRRGRVVGSFARFAYNPALSDSGLIVTAPFRERERNGVHATPGFRVGIGHDTHRLAPGGPLRLGGVEIPHDRHLVGHSDADVLLHALTDALLGAAGLGDIGELFPDTDAGESRPRFGRNAGRGARSGSTRPAIASSNVDCIVFAQRAQALALQRSDSPADRRAARRRALRTVGIKAKTGEQVGPVGRQEAIDGRVRRSPGGTSCRLIA